MYRTIIFLLLPLLAQAQLQPDCTQLLHSGDALMAQKDPPLEEALRAYLNALNCNSQLAGVIGPKLQQVFDAIKQQKENEKAATKKALAALEKSRQDQINKLLSDATTFRKQDRYADALRSYAEASKLAQTAAERTKIEQQQTQTQQEQIDFDFEHNRNTGFALKAANDCHAALSYLKKALQARPDDPVVKKALETCEKQ